MRCQALFKAGKVPGTGGFTLPEMLITLSLIALLAGAVVASVAGGFRVWGRATAYGANDQAALLAFENLRRDLHNAAPFALLPFSGAYDELTFAAVGRDPHEPDALKELGRHGYYLDEVHDVLCRSFVPYRLAREVRLKDRCEVVLEHVQRLRLDYFGAEGETQEAAWTGGWETETAPMAVKISVTMQDGKRPATSHSTVVFLPPVGRSDDEKS
jgi:prepilin-type N-terminal cleavage/methylation domain-containing protein